MIVPVGHARAYYADESCAPSLRQQMDWCVVPAFQYNQMVGRSVVGDANCISVNGLTFTSSDDDGLHYVTNGTDQYVKVGAVSTPVASPAKVGTTFASCVIAQSTTVIRDCFLSCGNSYNKFLFISSNGSFGQIRVEATGVGQYFSLIKPFNTKYHRFVVTRTASDKMTAYIDSSLTNQTLTLDASVDETNYYCTLGAKASSGITPGLWMDAAFGPTAVWNRVLSDGEISIWMDDPLAMFRKRRTSVLMPSTGMSFLRRPRMAGNVDSLTGNIA